MRVTDHPELDLAAILDFAEGLARQAGMILRMHFERARESGHKSSDIDLVTAADRASEDFIVGALRAAYPDHHIVGEEGGGYGPAAEDAAYHWHVDPLDGTTNFAHRMPHFAVSLALSDAHLNPILGVVYDPMMDELFKGVRGSGAVVNGRRLRVTEEAALSRSLVATGFPYDRWTNRDNNVEHAAHFIVRSQGFRRVGAAALDLCYVAAGRYELYWENGAKPWDVQAGILFVEEAGGKVTDYHGARTLEALGGHRILATNGLVHDQAVAVLTQGDAAPRPQPDKPA